MAETTTQGARQIITDLTGQLSKLQSGMDDNVHKMQKLEDNVQNLRERPPTSSSSTKTAKLNKDVSDLLDQLQGLVSLKFAQNVEHDTERLIDEVAKWISVVFTDDDRHDALQMLVKSLEKKMYPGITDKTFERILDLIDEKGFCRDGEEDPHKREQARSAAGTPRDSTDTEGRDKSAHSKDDPSKDKETKALLESLADHAHATAGATPRASGGAGGK